MQLKNIIEFQVIYFPHKVEKPVISASLLKVNKFIHSISEYIFIVIVITHLEIFRKLLYNHSSHQTHRYWIILTHLISWKSQWLISISCKLQRMWLKKDGHPPKWFNPNQSLYQVSIPCLDLWATGDKQLIHESVLMELD